MKKRDVGVREDISMDFSGTICCDVVLMKEVTDVVKGCSGCRVQTESVLKHCMFSDDILFWCDALVNYPQN